jgi:sulfur carrier protein
MIALQINGTRRELPNATPLLEFLASKEIDPRFVVVEHNGEIVRRNAYADVMLNEGDVVEIVHMMGGGA